MHMCVGYVEFPCVAGAYWIVIYYLILRLDHLIDPLQKMQHFHTPSKILPLGYACVW